MRCIPNFRKKSLSVLALCSAAMTCPATMSVAADELAVNPFNPGKVIAPQFRSKPLAAPQEPKTPIAQETVSARSSAPTPPSPSASDSIVLEINLEIDRNRTEVEPPQVRPTSAPARKATTLYDFSKTTATPAALSVPSEGAPVPLYRIPERAPKKKTVAPNRPALPFTTETAAINISEPETIPQQADKPVFLGTSVRLGDTLDDTSSCFVPDGAEKRICVQPVDWPAEMGHLFEVSSILYRGQKAVVRLDDTGHTEAIYGLFPAEQFKRIAGHLTLRFGPAEEESPPMALIGNPTARNLVLLWKRINDDGGTTILELRANDDLRDILPDESHGVVRLYLENGTPIFTDVQTSDFLLRGMRADAS